MEIETTSASQVRSCRAPKVGIPRRPHRFWAVSGVLLLTGVLLFGLLLSPTSALARGEQAPVPPGTPSVVTIYPNGSISSPSAPIARNGNVYSLTADLTGSIVIEHNGSTLQGTPFSIDYAAGGNGFAVTLQSVQNVTLTGLHVADAPNGSVRIAASSNVSVINNDLAIDPAPLNGIFATSSEGVTIQSNTLGNATAAVVEFQSVTWSNVSSNTFTPGIGYAFYIASSSEFNLSGNAAAETDGAYLLEDSSFSVFDNSMPNSEYGFFGQGIISYRNQGGTIIGNNLVNDTYPFISTFDQNMTISGNNFTAQPGFMMYSVNFQNDVNITFSDNIVSNLQQVYLLRSNTVAILANSISANWGSGIYVDDSQNTVVAHNVFSGDSFAVEELGDASGLLFTHNTFQTPAVGVGVYSSNASNIVIANNNFAPISGLALQLTTSSQISVVNDEFAGAPSGIALTNDSAIQVAQNTFTGAGPVVIGGAVGSLSVNDNSFTATATLSVSAAAGAGAQFTITSNEFRNDLNPLTISGWTGGAVTENSIATWSGSAGILGTGLMSTSFDANVVSGGPAAVPDLALVGSDGTFVTGNTLAAAGVGISLASSAGNVFTQNVVQNDGAAYALGAASTGNEFYHNAFISDGAGAIAPSSLANAWNASYPIGGNYWSNHTGPDLLRGPSQNAPGPDGIVDTPLPLATGVADRYPLVSPWTVRNLTFVETGLLPGAAWSVTVNGTTIPSHTSSIVFPAPSAAYVLYQYTVTGPSSYYPNPDGGSVWVNQSSVSVPVQFSTSRYAVQFSESGLASGTTWSVTFGSQTLYSSTPTVSFEVPNGSYSFTVGFLPGYSASPSGGPLTVAGASIDMPVEFTGLASFELAFTVTAGLPSGASWGVTINTQTISGTDSTLGISVRNGTYTYQVNPPNGFASSPPSGVVVIAGSPETVDLTFHVSNLTLTFEQSGLPAGTAWRVSVQGTSSSTSESGTGSAISFELAAGAYAYTITAPGYLAQPSNGVLQLNSNTAIPVVFTPSTFVVTFIASGLPAHALWNVSIRGTVHSSTQPVIQFLLVNGTYPYSVASWNASTPNPANGTVTVSGAALNVTIGFPAPSSGSGGAGVWPLLFWIAFAIAVVLLGLLLFLWFVFAERRSKPPRTATPHSGGSVQEWKR